MPRGTWRWAIVASATIVAAWGVLRVAQRWAHGAVTLPPPRERPAPPRATAADFVGAERCQRCHADIYAAWQRSTHGRAGGAPSPSIVIAAFDGRPIRFRDAVVTPRTDGGRYEFVVARDGAGAETFTVDGAIGGGHLEGGGTQGFVSKRPDGTWRFLPFDWSRQGHTWFCNTNSRAARGWLPITPALRLEDCGDWPPIRVLGEIARYANCQSCHASQLTVTLDTVARRYDTRFTSLAITCESCHGPGRRHVELAERGDLAKTADIGYLPLATLDKDASTAVCYQCHALKDQLRRGYLSGDSLAAYYSLSFPHLGDRPLLPDGRVRTFAYQDAQRYSDCYLDGGMTCTSCHDPHSQTYRDVAGTPLAGRFDDRQCTSCHASKVARATEHTHHAAGSPGSRCTACHMPYLQEPETGSGAVRYARSDHSIAIPRPAADSASGVRDACVQCHANRSVLSLDQSVRQWWGPIKPMRSEVAEQRRYVTDMSVTDAVPLLLGTAADTAADRHAYARFAGMSRFLERYVTPDDPALPVAADRRLRQLATVSDVDVRALALATLHLARGGEPAVRRFLAGALRSAGAHDAGLRARWALALGFMGDKFVGDGNLTNAVTAYERALEVTPAQPRLLLNLANAQRDAGDLEGAVRSYGRSLDLDAAQPIAWVNLGIALESARDTAAAEGAFRHAIALDPSEPLAWFNLGNVVVRRGGLDSALVLYGRAVALDRGLTPAQFQIARIRLLRRDGRGALRALRDGLGFDSSDAAARETAHRLERDLARRVTPRPHP